MRRPETLPPVRHVRHTVRHPVRHQTRASAGLCGMCGINRARAHKQLSNHAHAHKKASCEKNIPHIPHIPHSQTFMRHSTPSIPHNHTAHTAHLSAQKIEEEEMDLKQMTCQPDNVAEFNQALKTHLPGAHDLIKALINRGMMQGLRGVTLAPVGTLPTGVQPVTSLAAENRIADIHHARSK